MKQAGCDVASASLLQVNKSYVRGAGEIDCPNFFTRTDVDDEIVPFVERIPHRIGNACIVTLEGTAGLQIQRISRAYQEISIWKSAKDSNGFRENNKNFYETDLIHRGKVTMYERAAQLDQLLVTWVLVADGKRAQIYDCHKIMHKIPLGGADRHHHYEEKSGHELLPVPNGVMEAESINDYQTGHDRRGAASSSNSTTHNTYEPHGDIQDELKRRFTKTIADKLQQACAKDSFDRLVLVAPAKAIGGLMEQLDADVHNRIVGVLPKDLTHYQDHVVMTHLVEMLVQAHV